MTCALRFEDSAKPAIERLLDYLGLTVEWKGEIGIVSKIEFGPARRGDASKERSAPLVSDSLKASQLHPGGTK